MSDRSIKVAMIGQKGYPPIHGGIEKHVAELAARLGDKGFSLTIYSRPHYSSLQGATGVAGVSVRRLPSIPTKHLDAMSHSLLATVDVLPRDFDIVHYHALGPGLLSGVPRWFGRKATVVTVHGLDWQREKWGLVARAILRFGEYGSVRFPQRTIVVSKALRDYYAEQHGRRTEYIPNGITLPCYQEPELIRQHGVDGRFILFVGRLVPEKGCHMLLEAYARLPDDLRQEFQLVIAGDAGFTHGYVRQLKRDAAPTVNFLGYVHGPILSELYTNAELVVLPSTLEGLSLTLLEGMSFGRCCLVSDIPPNVEAASDHAPMFPSTDVEALTKQLDVLLRDDLRRADYGRRAQLHVIENYSWQQVAEQTAKLYRELIGA
ncbi:MAG: glycosyltransferase family 4 protein [bacterium]